MHPGDRARKREPQPVPGNARSSKPPKGLEHLIQHGIGQSRAIIVDDDLHHVPIAHDSDAGIARMLHRILDQVANRTAQLIGSTVRTARGPRKEDDSLTKFTRRLAKA